MRERPVPQVLRAVPRGLWTRRSPACPGLTFGVISPASARESGAGTGLRRWTVRGNAPTFRPAAAGAGGRAGVGTKEAGKPDDSEFPRTDDARYRPLEDLCRRPAERNRWRLPAKV